jgi:hypothetical protein
LARSEIGKSLSSPPANAVLDPGFGARMSTTAKIVMAVKLALL